MKDDESALLISLIKEAVKFGPIKQITMVRDVVEILGKRNRLNLLPYLMDTINDLIEEKEIIAMEFILPSTTDSSPRVLLFPKGTMFCNKF